MIADLLITINEWMAGGSNVAALGCFLWGVASVALSPCHMASIPLIVSYVAGQEKGLRTRSAAFYAAAFTVGLFITIALVGFVCALLGRMLGDVGPWWTIVVGVILIWVALDMLGIQACSLSGGLMARLRVRGIGGAFLLGWPTVFFPDLAHSGLSHRSLRLSLFRKRSPPGYSSSCFSVSGTAFPSQSPVPARLWVRRVLEKRRFRQSGLWFRRMAGVAIAGLGIYFILQPFVNGST